MHPELMLLLELQDLHGQKHALEAEPGIDEMEEGHFKLDPGEAVEVLEKKIEELTEDLDPAIRDRWQRGLPSLGRMVVPVIGGVCYGCFVSIPTSRSGDLNEAVQTCQNCGRFIYVLS